MHIYNNQMFPSVDHLGFLENTMMQYRYGDVQTWKNSKQCTQSTLRPLVYVVRRLKHKPFYEHTHTHSLYESTFNHSNYIPSLTPFIPCIHTLFLTKNYTPILANGSAQDVQVNRRCLGQALEQIVDFFDVESHVGLPLPAAQH